MSGTAGEQSVRKRQAATSDFAGERRQSLIVHVMTHESLSREDKVNIALLVLLYLLQGVPVGLAFGSVPFLLKKKVSFTDIGIFSLAQYPYSLKLLWSPIVDSVYISRVGRRKTWIIPMQTLIGLLFCFIGSNIDATLADDNVNVYHVTALFVGLVLCAATQDIAVDGWALELLSKEHREYASTCQTIGLNCGYFLSFTIFLAFNSAEFCNSYIRTTPSDVGLLQLGPYVQFWGVVSLVTTAWLALFKHERELAHGNIRIATMYRTLWDVAAMPAVRTLLIVLMVHKIGFMANDAVTGLLLSDKGLQPSDLALVALLDFPCQIVLGIFAARWSTGARPTRPWTYAQVARLGMCVVAMFVVHGFPDGGPTRLYYVIVVTSYLLTSFTSTIMFVSQGAFFARISDAAIGGSYLTLLNTVSNLGGTWPKYFVLKLVDYFTVAECRDAAGDMVGECVSEHGKAHCHEQHGVCTTVNEGYYPVSTGCVLLGLAVYLLYVRNKCKMLEKLPPEQWQVAARSSLYD